MILFLGTDRIFLPSPMVARNLLGSNPSFFLAANAGFISYKYSPWRRTTFTWRHTVLLGSGALTTASSPRVVTIEQLCLASDVRMGVKQEHNRTATDEESYAINRSSRHDSDARVARDAAAYRI